MDTKVAMPTAKKECQELGSRLAVLDSNEEMNWFFDYRENMDGKLATKSNTNFFQYQGYARSCAKRAK